MEVSLEKVLDNELFNIEGYDNERAYSTGNWEIENGYRLGVDRWIDR